MFARTVLLMSLAFVAVTAGDVVGSTNGAPVTGETRVTRVAVAGDSVYAVGRDGVLLTSKTSGDVPGREVQELAVRGLRKSDDLGQPISWRVAGDAIHFAWIWWDNRGEVHSSIVVRPLSSLLPANDPLDAAPLAAPKGSVLGHIGGLNLHWKLAKRSEDDLVGIDFAVKDRAVYTFVARLKDTTLKRIDNMRTFSYDLRDPNPANRTNGDVIIFEQTLALPLHLVTANGSLFVIDADLHVHELGEKTLTQVGELRPAKNEAANIVLLRNDDADQTTILERIDDDLQVVHFRPTNPDFANPFSMSLSVERKTALERLLKP